MILISVKSPFMDIKHQEETDKGAEKWLIKTQKLHQLYLINYIPKQPVKPHGSCSNYSTKMLDYSQSLQKWNELKAECKMRIEIINTQYNQLLLPLCK